MLKTRLGQEEATDLSALLQDIAKTPQIADPVRKLARRLARSMRPSMPRRDLQRVAWFLDEVTTQPPISSKRQEAIRMWTAYLEGLI